MDICAKDKCTGCFACVNACSHGCISMQEDELGCVHPVVDETNCVNCGLCKSSCPNNIELKFSYPIKCYASWIEDKEKRKICASGGIGTCMSEYVIKHDGVVFGSRYDSELTPIMTYTERIDELECFKGSRYVQSLVGNDTYKDVRTFLRSGRLVLFIGTPCQVAGLKTFLRKDYNNLITVDLICHGVCPTKYFKEEIAYLTEKYNLNGVADIRFRGNDENNYREKILRLDETQQYYIKGFLLGISMRENCYSCNYSRPERVSDITIGDFIGLGRTVPFEFPKYNVSSVTTNSSKGLDFYQKVTKETNILINIERDYRERLLYKPSLMYPFERHHLNEEFVELYKNFGYLYAIRKVLHKTMKREQFHTYLNYWTYLYRIPRKLYRIIIKHS